MDMSVWEWPQWVLAGLMAIAFVVQLGVMLSGVKFDASNVATSMISRIILFTILYFGGFWA